jgi:MYXO-CTERM domain-containing protein
VAVNGTRQFTGSAADGCGNPLSTPITWSTNVTGAMISASGLFTAGTTPGTFASGVTATATEGASMRSASAGITVSGGAVATVTVTPSTATIGTGQTATFTAVALDGFGNVVAGTPTWAVVAGGGTINGAGLFTAGTTAGTFTNTVRATIGGVDGTATVVVQPGPVTRVAVSPSTATLAPMGTTTFTAQAFDANNNVVTAAVTWSASAAAGSITAGGTFTAGSMSGNYPAAVTATVGSISGTASVTINPGALAQLTVVPAVASTTAGGTVAFTATGRDGNGNTVAVTPTWSVVAGGGTISTAGVFTAGTTTGTFVNTVRAESNGVTAFATVAVTAGPLVRIDVTPSSADLLEGAAQQFTGAGSDAFNNSVPVNVTWSANPAAGTITPAGLFTASLMPGDYAMGVTATQGAVTGSASVRVRSSLPADGGMDGGVDAGMEPMDSGTPDAGTQMDGGGTTMMMATSGCGCSTGDVGALGVLGLLATMLRRRRPTAARRG